MWKGCLPGQNMAPFSKLCKEINTFLKVCPVFYDVNSSLYEQNTVVKISLRNPMLELNRVFYYYDDYDYYLTTGLFRKLTWKCLFF